MSNKETLVKSIGYLLIQLLLVILQVLDVFVVDPDLLGLLFSLRFVVIGVFLEVLQLFFQPLHLVHRPVQLASAGVAKFAMIKNFLALLHVARRLQVFLCRAPLLPNWCLQPLLHLRHFRRVPMFLRSIVGFYIACIARVGWALLAAADIMDLAALLDCLQLEVLRELFARDDHVGLWSWARSNVFATAVRFQLGQARNQCLILNIGLGQARNRCLLLNIGKLDSLLRNSEGQPSLRAIPF